MATKVYNYKNYLKGSVLSTDEKAAVEQEGMVLAKNLTKRLNYDLCTRTVENKLAYMIARAEYWRIKDMEVDRNSVASK